MNTFPVLHTTEAQAVYFLRLRARTILCEATPGNRTQRAAKISEIHHYFTESAPTVALTCAACPWREVCSVALSRAAAVVSA
jgi:hypothetical protein